MMLANGNKVKVKILASVYAEVTLGLGETVNDICDRDVDIYLHGWGDHGYSNKCDLGVDTKIIATDPDQVLSLVDTGFLLALIDTAKRASDNENVYDDLRGTSYDWSALNELVHGLDSELEG